MARNIVGSAGSTNARLRMSAWTSGTISVVVVASQQNDPSILNSGPAGSVMPPVAAVVAGGTVAGGTAVSVATIKAASTAAAATDTSLVVQPLVGNAAMVTAAAGVQKVGVVGGAAGAALDAANNATAPANVLMAGVQMQTGAQATAGTAGQAGNLVAGLDHVLYVREGGPVQWSCFVEAVTVTTQCLAAPAAGLKAYVDGLICSNEAATAQSVDVVFGTGANCVTGITALTHKIQFGTVATTTSPFVANQNFLVPLQPTAANAICLRPTAATAFGCTLTGHTAP
jgi:hypothetical protein